MLKRYFRYYIIFPLLFFAVTSGFSQQCTIKISGEITDFHDHHYLEYANVFIQELKTGVTTDDKGVYAIDNLCAGSYHIIISHIGCGSKTLYVHITKDTIINVIMEHHDELLDEVLIEGQNSQSKTGQIKTVISKDILLEKSGSNLSEILAAIPGVTILRSGPNLTKPIIQGLYGHRITILNNGIPQEGQQWGNDHAPEIDPNTADKISIYKGANAIKYGLSTLGGLIVLEPNELTYDPHWHGDIKATTQTNGRVYGLSTTVRKSTKWGNTKWSGGFANGGDRRTPNYYLTNTGNKEKSFSFLWTNDQNSANYRKFYYSFYQNEIGILRGSHIGNLTDLKSAFTREIPFFTSDTFGYSINAPRQNVKHHLTKYSHKYTISDLYSLNIDAAIQANLRQEYDVRRGGRSNIPSLDLVLISQFYDLQLIRRSAHNALQNAIGVQYKSNFNSNRPGTGIRPLIPDYLSHQTAIYSILKNKWYSMPVEIGFRTEYRNYRIFRSESAGNNANHDFVNVAANFGIKKEISKYLNTALDISYTARPPEINELYSNGLHQGVSGIEEGNDQLHAERSFKIVHEWNGHITHHHHVNFGLFYNKFSNFIYLQPQEELRLTIRGGFPVFKYVGADVDMAGFNVKSNYQINHHLLWSNSLNYTYAHNNTLGQGLIRIPPFSYITSIGYTTGKTKLYDELKIGLEMSYTSRQNNVNPNEDFLAPPNDYLLTNGSIRTKWKSSHQNNIDLILRCENIFNIKYRDYLNRLRYFADDMGRNLYLSLNITF